jgi:hypothetical protein
VTIHNRTKLLTKGIRELVNQAASLLHCVPCHVTVRYRDGQRSECRHRVGSGIELLVRRPTARRPYTAEFLRSFVANLRSAMAKYRRKRPSRTVYWVNAPEGMELKLWELEQKAPALPRRVQNAQKTKKALERCYAAMKATGDKLMRLQKRAKVLERKVRYYEKNVNEGPEFEAKLQQLVKSKWGELPDAIIESGDEESPGVPEAVRAGSTEGGSVAGDGAQAFGGDASGHMAGAEEPDGSGSPDPGASGRADCQAAKG